MPVPFAINGLGRIGRCLLRIAEERDDLELVAVNDVEGVAGLAARVERDSVYGPFAGTVEAGERALVVSGRRVAVHSAAEPAAVPWGESGARVVVEASGRFAARERAAGHLGGSVERVVISANAPDADVTLCRGINDAAFDPARHRVISNASCTTYCLAALVRVLDRAFGIERATMSTTHPYTRNQRLLDAPHPDPRRARAAALNVVPTPTTAAEALGRLMPHLAGRVEGLVLRVPTPAVGVLDLVASVSRETRAEAVRESLREAAAGELDGVLAVEEGERVSSDFVGRPESAIADLPLVAVAAGRLARVVAWYDNEWGYAARLADLVARVGRAEGGARSDWSGRRPPRRETRTDRERP